MKKTAYIFIIAAAAVLRLCATPSFSQSMGTGVIRTVNEDGTLTIKTGGNTAFEEGDILVIQRNGMKIGLAHVDQSNASETSATVTLTEGNNSVMPGDVVAYEVLSGSSGSSVYSRSYASYIETEQPPNIMKREWQSTQPQIPDYDAEINRWANELNKNAHNRSAMIRLADAYFKKGWYKHAIKWNQRAIEESPKADDNDKLLFQIIRSYGYENDPDKQQLYMDFLVKHYPASVFATMKESVINRAAGEKTIPNWKKTYTPIIDELGFQKGGMRSMQKSPMEEIQTPSASDNVGYKLLHGKPELMSPMSQ